jgi:hypothetical protein
MVICATTSPACPSSARPRRRKSASISSGRCAWGERDLSIVRATVAAPPCCGRFVRRCIGSCEHGLEGPGAPPIPAGFSRRPKPRLRWPRGRAERNHGHPAAPVPEVEQRRRRVDIASPVYRGDAERSCWSRSDFRGQGIPRRPGSTTPASAPRSLRSSWVTRLPNPSGRRAHHPESLPRPRGASSSAPATSPTPFLQSAKTTKRRLPDRRAELCHAPTEASIA